MIVINLLLYFVIGFICAQWIVPLFDELISLISTFIEAKKMKISVSMANSQKEIEEISESTSVKTPLIGFFAPPEFEEEEDE